MVMIKYGNQMAGGSRFSMSESKQQRKWVREEVVILVTEYFRTKNWSSEEISEVHQMISNFLRKREEIMQSGRIRCLDPETQYSGMQGTKLQKQIVQEYLTNPQKIIAEAKRIYAKYDEND